MLVFLKKDRQVTMEKLLLLIDSKKKAELNNIFCAYFFCVYFFRKIWILCIFVLYLFSRMLFKRKFACI